YMAIDKKLYDQLMAMDDQQFEQFRKTYENGKSQAPARMGILPRIGAGLQTMVKAAPSVILNDRIPTDTVSDLDEKMYLEKYKAGLKPTHTKIMKSGSNVVQVNADTGEVETLIKGGPTVAEQEFQAKQEKEARKLEENRIKHEESINLIKNAAQDRLNTISTIKKGIKYFGRFGGLPSGITAIGSEEYNKRKTWENATNRLLAQLGFDVMTELKNASRTGATGLGALSEKEGQWLREASTELTRDLSKERAMEILNELERLHKKILEGGSKNVVYSQPSQSYEDALAEIMGE
ncbi:MAG: hypothetical protein SFH39_00550, partial [Candidatus Magnetobacterium sp. LHC-1]